MKSSSFFLRQLPGVMLLVLLSSWAFGQPSQDHRKTENVFLVTIDGMRWQEVFGGAQREILESKTAGRVRDLPGTRTQFWRETPEQRREALMPFLWTEIA